MKLKIQTTLKVNKLSVLIFPVNESFMPSIKLYEAPLLTLGGKKSGATTS